MRSQLLKLVLGAGITIAAVALVEGVARIASTIVDDFGQLRPSQFESGFVASSSFGWVRKPGYDGPTTKTDTNRRVFDDEGYYTADSAQVADEQTPRIVFIGDSNTFGYGVPTDDSFVEVVDRLLDGIHAINLGVPGYSSAQGRLVAEEYLPRLKPAIAVISFNFNDRRYAFAPDGPERFLAAYRLSDEYLPRRVALLLERSHAFRAFRRVLRMVGAAPPVEPPPEELDLAAMGPRVTPEAYRRNLTDIVALCRRAGVLPVLLVLGDRPTEGAALRESAAILEQGDLNRAIETLEAALTVDPDLDLIRLRLAALYEQSGQPQRALVTRTTRAPQLSFDGGNPIRPDTEYHQIMKEVAAESGTDLVDAASLLQQTPEVFIDTCHFNRDGHARVGALLAARLRDHLNGDVAGGATGRGTF